MDIRLCAARNDVLFTLPFKTFLKILAGTDLLVIAAAVGLGLLRGDLPRQFGEHSLPTLISFAQLLLAAIICWKVFDIERSISAPGQSAIRSSIWAVFSAGFVYLALDEILRIHERMDRWIHAIFNLENSPLSARMDDGIVALYIIGGSLLLLIYWPALKKFAGTWPFFAAGFAVAGVMVVADFFAAYWQSGNPAGGNERLSSAVIFLEVLEDSCKLIAEGSFLAGFFLCRSLAAGEKA